MVAMVHFQINFALNVECIVNDNKNDENDEENNNYYLNTLKRFKFQRMISMNIVLTGC